MQIEEHSMACGGCRGGSGNRGVRSGSSDLSKFAYLKPNQLKILEEQRKSQNVEEGEKEDK